MRLVCVLDTNDLVGAADFWCGALGFERAESWPSYLALRDAEGRWPDLLLQEVPEGRCGKNRMHWDLVVDDVDAEVERVSRLGAHRLRPAYEENGHYLAVMADPEGNEFCVVQPLGRAT